MMIVFFNKGGHDGGSHFSKYAPMLSMVEIENLIATSQFVDVRGDRLRTLQADKDPGNTLRSPLN